MAYITISSGSIVATIPKPASWAVVCDRPKASRQTLAGTTIHQIAAKDISAAVPTLDTYATAAEAASIDAIDALSGLCYICDGEHLYEATIDAKVAASEIPGKKKVTASFGIVRRVW